jgi:hypothetical protein
MKIFEEYTKNLKGMYCTRFNWRFTDRDASMQTQSVPRGHTLPFKQVAPCPSLTEELAKN